MFCYWVVTRDFLLAFGSRNRGAQPELAMPRTCSAEKFKAVIKKTKQKLPFKLTVDRPLRLVGMRERQLASTIHGLAFLKAPVVLYLQI